MNKDVLMFLSLLLTLVSCENKNTSLKKVKVLTQSNIDSLKNEKQRYTIINDTIRTNLDSYAVKAFWTPTQKQLKTIFAITRETILKNQKKHSRHLKADSLDSAYKQISCYIDHNGDSLVYINAICQIMDYPALDSTGSLRYYRQDWQNKITIPKDGGDCFWRIHINFSKKKAQGLYANGEA